MKKCKLMYVMWTRDARSTTLFRQLSPWPTFIILSLEGLFLLQCRLAVIVYHTGEYCVCVFVCSCLRTRQPVCVSVTKRLLAALIHKAFGTRFRHLFLGPSPLWLSPLVKRPDSRAGVCVSCVHVWLRVDRFLHASFSAGISLLVPHGGITEDTTWEMYMIINQEDSRWGTRWSGAVCFSFNLSTRHTASLVPLPCTANMHTDPPVQRMHSHVYCAHIQYRCGHIPAQQGILAHLAETTGEDMCVTNALAAVDRLHYCLKQLSQQRKTHSTTPVACFVFVDTTVTVSPSIVTG